MITCWEVSANIVNCLTNWMSHILRVTFCALEHYYSILSLQYPNNSHITTKWNFGVGSVQRHLPPGEQQIKQCALLTAIHFQQKKQKSELLKKHIGQLMSGKFVHINQICHITRPLTYAMLMNRNFTEPMYLSWFTDHSATFRVTWINLNIAIKFMINTEQQAILHTNICLLSIA